MDDVRTRNRVDHRQALEQLGDCFAIRVVGAGPDGAGQRFEPLRSICKLQVVGRAERMREELADRRVRVGAVRFELADPIVQRQLPLFDAPQDQCGGEDLRETVQMKRGFWPGRDQSVDILKPEGLLPDDVVGADDRGGQTGDAGLNAERFEIIGESAEDQILCMRRRADSEQHANRDDYSESAHMCWSGRGLLAIIPEFRAKSSPLRTDRTL